MAKMEKKGEKILRPGPRSRPLSAAQVETLLVYVRDRATAARLQGNSRAVVDELIIDLLLEAGLKPNELCDLCIAHTPVFRPDNTIAVQGSHGHRVRDIPISQALADRIKRFVSLYRQGAAPEAPLILSERGNPLGYFSVYSKVRRIGEDAGLSNLQPNTLRKTYIFNLFVQEQDLRLVQQQAGHSSPKTTALFVRQVPPKPNAKRADRRKCEACGRRVSMNRIARIDSGQILCAVCLGELHG